MPTLPTNAAQTNPDTAPQSPEVRLTGQVLRRRQFNSKVLFIELILSRPDEGTVLCASAPPPLCCALD